MVGAILLVVAPSSPCPDESTTDTVADGALRRASADDVHERRRPHAHDSRRRLTMGVVETVPGPLDGERIDRVVAMVTGVSRAEAAELVSERAWSAATARSPPARSARLVEGDVVEVDVALDAPVRGPGAASPTSTSRSSTTTTT